ncbi:hypothetical protein AB205_0207210, partial [Aquarana catesbeiana]
MYLFCVCNPFLIMLVCERKRLHSQNMSIDGP